MLRTLLAVSLAVAWCSGTAVTAETKDGDAEKVDAATYCAIRTIRSKIKLRNETIAAMGCDQAAAREVLETLLLWYRVKEPYLNIAEKTRIRAARELRDVLQKIGMGPRDEKLIKSVPTLKAARIGALRDYNNILKTGITAVEAKLSPARKALWAAARANGGRYSRYRYATNITAAQVKALHQARRAYARKVASAKTSAGKAAVTSEFRTIENKVLSADQKAAMAQAAENIRKNMAAVSRAESKVLPLPDELKPPQPGIDPVKEVKP